MSISDPKNGGLLSKIPKMLLYGFLLAAGFSVGILYSNYMNGDHKILLDSLNKGALAECIPANLLTSGEATTLYLEEICNFTNRLGGGIAAADVENTIRIHEADADALRSNFASSPGQTTAVVFSIPELFKVLMQATNVTRISEDEITLENLGLGIVFGKYPSIPPDYIPIGAPYSAGSNTCYVEFVKLKPVPTTPAASGNFYYESVMGPAFNYPNVTSTLTGNEPLLYNFPRLCPYYCPPSTQ